MSDWFTQTQTTNISDFNSEGNDQVFNQDSTESGRKREEDWKAGQEFKIQSSNGLFFNVKSKDKKKNKGNSTIFQNAPSYTKQTSSQARKICFCEGQRHKFLANCLNCGHIVCEAEGVGICLFCGEQIIMADPAKPSKPSKSSNSKENQTQNMKDGLSDFNFEKALKQRNKLIEFDLNKENTVLDEQLDDLESTTNVWLTEDERTEKKKKEEKLKKLKEQRQRDAFFQIDYSTGRILLTDADHAITETDVDKKIKTVESAMKTSSGPSKSQIEKRISSNISKQKESVDKINDLKTMIANPSIILPENATKLKFVDDSQPKNQKISKDVDWAAKHAQKLQDTYFALEEEVATIEKQKEKEEKEAEDSRIETFKNLFFSTIPSNFTSADVLQWTKKRQPLIAESNTRDTFKVLCMHQPWASLLIEGIKTHEGSFFICFP